MVKNCYINEVEATVKDINDFEYDLSMALVADSHLDNSIPDTLCNLKAVDNETELDCLIHLGDFMNGNLPRKYTMEILDCQMKDFNACVKSGVFLPVQGNHDGFTDFAEKNHNVTLDEDWSDTISFVDRLSNLKRNSGKPYFYMDYPDKKIRLVVICSFHYRYDDKYVKLYGISKENIDWLEKDALNLSEGWTVLLFSHDVPFADFNEETLMTDNPRNNGNLALETVLKCKKERGFDIPAWIVGHFHGDMIKNLFGINFVLVGNETAYVPRLWDMPEGGVYNERVLNSVTEDLWDVALLNLKQRKIKFVRFGAGCDREITY